MLFGDEIIPLSVRFFLKKREERETSVLENATPRAGEQGRWNLQGKKGQQLATPPALELPGGVI